MHVEVHTCLYAHKLCFFRYDLKAVNRVDHQSTEACQLLLWILFSLFKAFAHSPKNNLSLLTGKQEFLESKPDWRTEHDYLSIYTVWFHMSGACVLLFTECVHALMCCWWCYHTFRADDSLQTSHGVGGPARLLSWKQDLETGDLLSVSSSDCWNSDLAFLVCVCVSLCILSFSLCQLFCLFCFFPPCWDVFIFILFFNILLHSYLLTAPFH